MIVSAMILGLAASIVLNAWADALPPDEAGHRRPLRRPHCLACGLDHPPEDWLAGLAWLRRRGRCAYCAAPRPPRPLWVEAVAVAGSAYLWSWAGGDWGRFLAAGLVSAIFLLITIIDIEHRLILWRVVWVSAILLALLGGLTPDRGWAKTLTGGLVGYALVALLFLFGQLYGAVQARLRGQPLEEVVFGGGDVNLAGLVGLAVGWSGVLVALLLAVLSAGLFSLGILIVQAARRRYNPHMAFPYGPFLAAGALVVYLHGRDLAAWWLAGR